MNTLLPVFYTLGIGMAIAGAAYCIAYQLRYTFFLPPVQGTILHTEKYRFVKSNALVFKNRAHIVVTHGSLTISVCRLFYKYWPGDVSVFRVAREDILGVDRLDGGAFNLRVRTSGVSKHREWWICAADPALVTRLLLRQDATGPSRG